MSFVALARGKSAWKGYEYYTERKVKACRKVSKSVIEGTVKGTNKEPYQVRLDLEHPRSSSCSCPFADGRRVVCKHMVALYFTAFPKEAEEYIREIEEYEAEQERYYEETEQKLADRINSMTKQELRNALWELLLDGPEWQFERFADQYID